MNENSVVISAPMDKAGGSVHIYDKNGTFIAQINGKDVDPLIKPNAEFGSSIKFLTCNLLLIGAKNNGQSGSGKIDPLYFDPFLFLTLGYFLLIFLLKSTKVMYLYSLK